MDSGYVFREVEIIQRKGKTKTTTSPILSRKLSA